MESHDVRRASLETGKLSNEVIWSFFAISWRNYFVVFFRRVSISSMRTFIQKIHPYFGVLRPVIWQNRHKRKFQKCRFSEIIIRSRLRSFALRPVVRDRFMTMQRQSFPPTVPWRHVAKNVQCDCLAVTDCSYNGHDLATYVWTPQIGAVTAAGHMP